jgi:hypothetical protein
MAKQRAHVKRVSVTALGIRRLQTLASLYLSRYSTCLQHTKKPTLQPRAGVAAAATARINCCVSALC